MKNFRNPNYSNKHRRENIGEEIGQLMKQTGKLRLSKACNELNSVSPQAEIRHSVLSE
jgi:hypothetical protein